jgi:outer membrane protein assembly factor BamB
MLAGSGRANRLIFLAGLILTMAVAARGETDFGAVVKASGVSAGLYVHLAGTNDVVQAATAATTAGFVVQIICPDAAAAARQRAAWRARGMNARIFVDYALPGCVPFADQSVNLLVVADASADDAAEWFRAVAPGGAAVIDAGVPAERIAAAGFTNLRTVDGFTVARKPRPAEMDEWTQARHGPERTATSQDRMVGPPQQLRWVDGPRRSTVHQGAPIAAVSAGGRFFSLIDAAMPFMAVPSQIQLVARDACNGVVLWSRPIDGKTWQTTPDIGTLVAQGDRVYTVLRANGPAVCLDAASGRELHTAEGSRPGEMLLLGRQLFLSEPNTVRAWDPESGTVQWTAKVEGRKNGLLAGGGKLFVLDSRGKCLTCLDPASGSPLWTRTEPAFQGKGFSGFVAGTVVLGGASELAGVAAVDGTLLWRHAYRKSVRSSEVGVFFPAGLVWVCDKGEKNSPYSAGEWHGLDPATGEIRQKFTGTFTDKCAPGVATSRFLITGRLDFFDVRDGGKAASSAARGVCRFGSVPANGLIYTFPNDCLCSPYLNGQMALAGPPVTPLPEPANGARLERGPGTMSVNKPAGEDDWPLFRRNPERGGCATTALPDELRVRWTADLGGHLTAATIADGRVFVAATDDHRVHALSAADGKLLWSFDTGGRVDSPPTYHEGLAIFGCRDGRVYAVNAASGERVWSFRAAPAERKIMAHGQPESVWPVSGSLPVLDGRVLVAAGRHTALDGGIRLCALEAASGKLLWEKPATGTGNGDLMIRTGDLLTLGALRFDPATGMGSGAKTNVGALAFGSVFNDPSYSVRTQWRVSGITGQMLSFDSGRVLGFHGNREKDKYSVTIPGKGQYALFLHADKRKAWEVQLPLRPCAVLLATDKAFVAGPSDAYPFQDGWLHWYAASDGRELGRLDLGATPSHDGLAAAAGQIYASTESGRLLCIGAR